MKLTFIDLLNNNGLLEYVSNKNIYKHCPVFRFCTLFMYGTPLNNMEPLADVLNILRPKYDISLGDAEMNYEFDMAYAQQLLANPQSFVDLMSLLYAFQESEEVFVSCNLKNDICILIVDSLMKFIQERYSIRSFIVKEGEDINDLAVSNFESPEGYQLFVQDFSKLASTSYTTEQLQNFTSD